MNAYQQLYYLTKKVLVNVGKMIHQIRVLIKGHATVVESQNITSLPENYISRNNSQ